jgi:shikimate 5-dehydrogenase
MLLAQGVASFRLWWRTEPPLEVMREALRVAATPSAMASPR